MRDPARFLRDWKCGILPAGSRGIAGLLRNHELWRYLIKDNIKEAVN